MNNDLHYLTAVEPQRNSIGRVQDLNWGEFAGSLDIRSASGQTGEILFYIELIDSPDRSFIN